MAIVRDYISDNGCTRIKISDDAYINRTPEEVARIMERVSAIAWTIANSEKENSKQVQVC